MYTVDTSKSRINDLHKRFREGEVDRLASVAQRFCFLEADFWDLKPDGRIGHHFGPSSRVIQVTPMTIEFGGPCQRLSDDGFGRPTQFKERNCVGLRRNSPRRPVFLISSPKI